VGGGVRVPRVMQIDDFLAEAGQTYDTGLATINPRERPAETSAPRRKETTVEELRCEKCGRTDFVAAKGLGSHRRYCTGELKFDPGLEIDVPVTRREAVDPPPGHEEHGARRAA
jgi:ribosomal protein S14